MRQTACLARREPRCGAHRVILLVHHGLFIAEVRDQQREVQPLDAPYATRQHSAGSSREHRYTPLRLWSYTRTARCSASPPLCALMVMRQIQIHIQNILVTQTRVSNACQTSALWETTAYVKEAKATIIQTRPELDRNLERVRLAGH
jgi:hypothetical protein